jgi:ribosomal protein L11 methyltransferase
MPLSYKTVLGLVSEHDAVKASAALSETPGFDDLALVVREDHGDWFLECYDDGALAGSGGESVLDNAGVKVLSRSVETVPQEDWVTETQRSLPPIRAGRFIVHGSHDRRQIVSRWAIEIDAGRAFGTAYHATTRGCLLAINELAGSIRPRSVLDLGTGSGVLAIAAAKTFLDHAQVAAADIDPIAIEVARENCRKNGAAASVQLFVGDGLRPNRAYRAAPFDIVIANILAKPLLRLAPRLRVLTKTGGVAILSGLLTGQAREVLGRYRATGFHVIRRRDLEGWVTLSLRRRA